MTRRLLAGILALCTVALPTRLSAQDIFTPLAADSAREHSFLDMENSFRAWSASRDLNRTKGWKWYARWEWFNRTRAYGDGSIPDQGIYWREASKVVSEKQRLGKRSSAAGWSPVGPMNLSEIPNPNLNAGLGRINCVAFHPTDPGIFWVGVAQGGVWKTTNGGESWRPLTDDLPILRISDIAVDPRHPDTMYISVGDYAYLGVDLLHSGRKRNSHYGMGVFKTTDGGETWSPTGLGFAQTELDASLIRRVFIRNGESSDLVAAGIGGIWTSSDAGATWSRKNEDIIWDIERDPVNPEVLYASTGYIRTLQIGGAGIMKSEDFGKTWRTLPSGLPTREVQRIELAISPSDPDYVYALACGRDQEFASLSRSTDGGQTWEVRAEGTTAPNILGWYSGSGEWGGQGTYDLAILVDPNDRERIYTGGVNLWSSADGGRTWNGVSFWLDQFGPSVHADQHYLAYNRLDDRFFVCNDGGLYATDTMVTGAWERAYAEPGYRWPTVWRNLTSGMAITSFYRIGLSRGNHGAVIAGAQDNSTYYKESTAWRSIFGGDGMDCLIHPDNPQLIYGSSQFGNIMKSTDGGESITYQLTLQILETGETGEWTTPIAMHPSNPDVIYAAYGNLWKSINGGESWDRISSFPPMPQADYPTPACAMSIVAEHPETIYLAKRVYHQFDQPTNLWRTTNDGASWQNITSGLPDSLYLTSIATHADDPNTAWVTFGGFNEGLKVFRTTNGGGTWENISSTLPNLPVNSVVHQAGSADNLVYVGTDIGVYYTSDRMEGWSFYSENLPNVIVSELEIDYAAGKLYAATFGRGVWIADLASGSARTPGESEKAGTVEATVVAPAGGGRILLTIAAPANSSRGSVEIVDITGRVVHRGDLALDGGRYSGEISIRLPYGVYFARIGAGGGGDVVKFLVE